MGSIPTRSRHPLCGWRLILVWLVFARCVQGASGAEPEFVPVPPAPADSVKRVPAAELDPDVVIRGSTGTESDSAVPWWRRPGAVMARSALIPGWGQVANRRYWKAGVVLGAEGYLVYRAVRAGNRERDAEAAARLNPADASEYEALADAYNEERRKYTWWTAFAVLFSMGDAYVDAVLGDVDAEFEPEDRELRLGWRMSWD